MGEDPKCWVCGRTGDQVAATLAGRTEKEAAIAKMASQVDESKRTFERSSNGWQGSAAEKFAETQFEFVLRNPDQFRALRFVDELTRAKKSLADPLAEVAGHVRRGEGANLGIVSLAATEKGQVQLVTRALDDFEKRTGRTLGPRKRDRSSSSGMPSGFEGMNLKEGVRHLVEVGELYYAMQSSLLQEQMEKVKESSPRYRVAMAKVKGFPANIPLCNVCEHLIG